MKRNVFFCFLIIVPLVFLVFRQKSFAGNIERKDDPKTYLNIEALERRVKSNAKKRNGSPLMIDDTNISEFLNQVEVENKRWNITTLELQDIKDRFGKPGNPISAQDEEKPLKTILYWNEAYGSTEYGFCCGQEPYERFSCGGARNCYVTNDRNYLPSVDQYDAILFHQRSLDAKDLPAKRLPHQRYIMFMLESASYPFNFVSNEWNGFFNWTMTYRTDSDFYMPYGRIKRIRELPEDLENYITEFGQKEAGKLAAQKKKAVAWFVSNCDTPSNRMEYVKALQKHIDVDIFGQCGPLKCPRNDENGCWKKVDDDYFFYLSFENSICKDYVTEKFFNAMNRSVVPITLGGADYNQIGPFKSFINAYQDFRNDPSQLARFLHNLMDDRSKYAEYFWWKDFYSVGETDGKSMAKTHCQICQKLAENESSQSIYNDLENWWEYQAKCKKVHVRHKEK